MTNKINDILTYFDEVVPNASCELNYTTDYELLIAVMLSAQTTDKSVNLVTEKLFKENPSLDDLAMLTLTEIEEYLKPLGLYKNKALHLQQIVYSLIKEFDYKVPNTIEKLVTLPGVGNKTARVVLCEIFKIPEFPVDTHVSRIAKRLKLVNKNDDPDEISKKLKKKFPKDRWIKSHHQFIHFGRYVCKAKNPACENCKLKDYCTYSK